VTNLVVV